MQMLSIEREVLRVSARKKVQKCCKVLSNKDTSTEAMEILKTFVQNDDSCFVWHTLKEHTSDEMC